jgi:ribonuclease R
MHLANFAQFAARFGYKINTKSDKETAKSLNFLMEDVEGKKEQNVLTQLAIRSMAKAIYTTKTSAIMVWRLIITRTLPRLYAVTLM